MPLVIEAWYALGLNRVAKKQVRMRERQKVLTDAEWVEVLTVLLVSGGREVEDLEALRRDAGLLEMWPVLRRASTRSALNYLHRFDDPELPRGKAGEALIVEETEGLKGLGVVNECLVRELQRTREEKEATIDVDASVHESGKRDALWTYDGVRGYQPVIAYWAEQGVVVGDQFRDGNVPAGMGNLEFIERVMKGLPRGIEKRRVRGDSALYEQKLLRWMDREGIEFGVSADMSVQLKEEVMRIPEEDWRAYEKVTEEGERVKTGREWAEVCYVPTEPGAKKGERPFRYIGIRVPKREPDLFGAKWEYFAVVTNRWDMGGNELLSWHRGKCGTVEQAHDMLKNDMGARVLPSGRYGANAAWYRLNVLAFNLMRTLGRIALRGYEGKRPYTMRKHTLQIAARVVSSSRQRTVTFSEENRECRDGLAEGRGEVRRRSCWGVGRET